MISTRTQIARLKWQLSICNMKWTQFFCTVPYPSNMFDKAQVLLIFRVLPLNTKRRWFSKFISHASRHLRIGWVLPCLQLRDGRFHAILYCTYHDYYYIVSWWLLYCIMITIISYHDDYCTYHDKYCIVSRWLLHVSWWLYHDGYTALANGPT